MPAVAFLLMGWIADAAPIASTALAAAAAGASWMSVRNGQRMWRAAIEPDLHMQVMINEVNRCVSVSVLNAGGGIAKGAALTLVAGDQCSSGYLRDGFLSPGDRLLISSAVTAKSADEVECLLGYRALDESSWAVTRTGDKRRFRKRPHGLPLTAGEIWTNIFPNHPRPAVNAGWIVEKVPE
jgi:hypothetical protein